MENMEHKKKVCKENNIFEAKIAEENAFKNVE